MAEEFGDPIVPGEGGAKTNTLLIAVLVLIILCCCCCGAAAGLYYGTEPLMELLGIPIPW